MVCPLCGNIVIQPYENRWIFGCITISIMSNKIFSVCIQIFSFQFTIKYCVIHKQILCTINEKTKVNHTKIIVQVYTVIKSWKISLQFFLFFGKQILVTKPESSDLGSLEAKWTNRNHKSSTSCTFRHKIK